MTAETKLRELRKLLFDAIQIAMPEAVAKLIDKADEISAELLGEVKRQAPLTSNQWAKWRADLEAIGGWDNELLSVPAGTVRKMIELGEKQCNQASPAPSDAGIKCSLAGGSLPNIPAVPSSADETKACLDCNRVQVGLKTIHEYLGPQGHPNGAWDSYVIAGRLLGGEDQNGRRPAEKTKPSQDERTLRRLLAFAYSGSAYLYGDDGELQDGRLPVIDYVRDSVPEIERKIEERGRRELIKLACPECRFVQLPGQPPYHGEGCSQFPRTAPLREIPSETEGVRYFVSDAEIRKPPNPQMPGTEDHPMTCTCNLCLTG